MARKSAAELKAEADAVNAVIVQGRKKTLNFALLIADEGVALAAHHSKGPEAMFRAAKADGGTARGTTGTLNVSGKVMEFTCVDDNFPSSLPKTAKRHFASLGIKVKIRMLLPDGSALDDGEPDDETDTAAVGQTAAGLATPETTDTETTAAGQTETIGAGDADGLKDAQDRKTDLVARFTASVQPVKDFAAGNAPVGAKLIEALKAIRAALGKEDFDFAEKLLATVERTLGTGSPKAVPMAPPLPEQKPTEAPQDDIEQIRARLKQAFATLADDLKLFLKRGEPSLASKAQQLGTAFSTDIAGVDMKRCATLVSTLKNFLAAHIPNLPIMSEAERAADAIAAAQGPAPASRYTQAAGLQGKYARGAVAARAAFDGFAAVIGDQPVTPELLARAKDEIATVTAERDGPQKRLDKAATLPQGPERDKLTAEANRDLAAVQARIDAAMAFEKAARCKDALTKALTVGPLSAGSGQTLPDATAAALIAAFTRDPEFAASAVSMAASSTHPEALAAGLPRLLDLKNAGFAAAGKLMDADKADAYAKDLLKMGGNVGAEFFARMPDYMTSGKQFEVDPLREKGRKGAALAQTRSVRLAGAMVGPDGTITTDSAQLNSRVGHLLFNPTSLENPTPAMNEYALKSIEMFRDPIIAKEANKILAGLPDAPQGGSETLIRNALHKGPGVVLQKKDMQDAVMASMLKSLDQGPVGSCFSTAPARRIRESDPMTAMKAYAQIAGNGTYKPPYGAETPVVTSIHKGEDPIMRSWEYTLATCAAKQDKSIQRTRFDNLMDNTVEDLAIEINDILLEKAESKSSTLKMLGMGVKVMVKQKSRTKQLKRLLSSSFDFVYNPVGESGDASDGKSTDGRYVMIRKGGSKEIRNEGDFIDEAADIACTAFGVAAGSEEAAKIRAAIAAPAIIDPIRNSRFSPWELPSGGFDEPITKLLKGTKQKATLTLAKGDPSVSEGTRTKEVLNALLTGFSGDKDSMQALATSGQHAFNGLPQDPSLAKLLDGGPSKLAANVQTHLVDKGAEIARTAVSADRAQAMYDKAVTKWVTYFAARQDVSALLARDIPLKRPTADMTPAQVAQAVTDATEAAFALRATHEPDDKQAGKLASLKTSASNDAKAAMVQEVGAPEFVIADSNWGGAENHVFFVIAPDPTSGEPIMWEKTVPPGSLRPSGRKWADAQWLRVQ